MPINSTTKQVLRRQADHNKTSTMRCFALPEAFKNTDYSSSNEEKVSAISLWLVEHQTLDFDLSATQQNALARLIPLLLCGEQSAVFVFHSERQRLSNEPNHNNTQHSPTSANRIYKQAIKNLKRIEQDELHHEQALQFLLQKLPKAANQHKIKRQAQKFYTQLQQKNQSIAQQFRVIAQLDACVCILMQSVANSSIKNTPLADLFKMIRKDEARHVAIAKKHSLLLADIEQQVIAPQDTLNIQQKLIELLSTQEQALKDLQINSVTLFEQLKHSQHT
jgi:hypothetical protein